MNTFGHSAQISDWLKFAMMHKLQERVAELGVCPKCHTKTLKETYESDGMSFNQCGTCLNVYVLVAPIDRKA